MRDKAWQMFLDGHGWDEIRQELRAPYKWAEKVVRRQFAIQFPHLAEHRFRPLNRLRAMAMRQLQEVTHG